MAEENRARAVPAPEAILLAEKREEARYHGVATGFAGRPAILQPIDAAIARAGAAIRERLDGHARAVREGGVGELQVRGVKHSCSYLLVRDGPQWSSTLSRH